MFVPAEKILGVTLDMCVLMDCSTSTIQFLRQLTTSDSAIGDLSAPTRYVRISVATIEGITCA